MILEAAMLNVVRGSEAAFETAFRRASRILASMPGYLSHELQRCIEVPGRYLLLVRWEQLSDHVEGFRKSPQYEEWRRLLHGFYDPFPTVEHFETVELEPDA
jgi:heme-degrading monooxygenase HmoA